MALLAVSVRAQFTYSEDFKNATAPGWVLNPAGNSTPNVILTSGAAPRTGDPESGGSIDSSGSGWMRLTNNTTNLHNAVYFDTPIPSAGNSVTIQFGVNLWGGNSYNTTGADGLTFFLYDGSKDFVVGARGGAMGYAQMNAVGGTILHDGLNGAFVGVALDPYGNFSVGTPAVSFDAAEGKLGGTATLQPNSVAVRGPGQGQSGYNYLAGTGNRDYTDTGSPTTQDPTDGAVPALPYTMAFPGAATRPNQSTQYRNVSITINESSQLLVSMQFGEDGLWYNLLNVDLSSFVRPEQLKMGFSGGTGGGTLITEVGGLLQIQATAGSGNFVWDNGEGASNRIWGTGATNPLNWAGNTNPTLKSSVIFNSTYVNVAQNIDVTGSDKVITNMYFSGPNSYTLGTSEARKLIFDSVTAGGLTAINLTNDVAGNTSHSIDLDLQMNRNLDINNNVTLPGNTAALTISGNIDTGGNVLGLKGAGRTELAGAISGAGSLVKSDSGTTVLRGATDNTYTGLTTINAGRLQIEKATALGSTAAGTVVNAGGTLALGGTGTTFAAEDLALNGTGDGGVGALYNHAGNNTWTGNIALASATGIGAAASTELNISGIISGANTLTKLGAGTLQLSGVNTYSGATTINEGNLKISADTNLGTAPGAATAGHLTFAGGTLQTTGTMTLDSNRGIALGASGGTIQTDAGVVTYNGIAAGSGSLTKSGAGTLSLGGLNTYSGATAITAGTLQLGANDALPSATAVAVSSGAVFDVNSKTNTIAAISGAGNVTLGSGTLTVSGTTSTTLSGVVSGTGGLTKVGASTLTLTGANTFTGATTIGNGTIDSTNVLKLGASNVLANTSSVVLNGGTLAVGGNFSDTVGSLSLLANSRIDFGGFNSTLTFGNVSRTAGTLTIDNWAGSAYGGGSSQLVSTAAPTGFTTGVGGQYNEISFTGWGSGAVRLGSGEYVPYTGGTVYTYALATGGNWNVDNNWSDGGFAANADPGSFASQAGDTAILGSSATGPATLSLAGADRTMGYLIVNNPNKYTISGNNLILAVNSAQAQIVNQGAGGVDITSGLRLGNATTITQAGSGNITIAGGIVNNAGNNNITVSGNGTGTITINSVIGTGTGSLTKEGTSTLVLSSASANTYSGGTTINGGTISLSNDNHLGATTGQLTLNGGTLQNTASTTLSSTRNVTLNANGGTFLTDAATILTYGGVLAGSGTLTKSGAGTLVLGGGSANTHTGAVNVDAGVLEVTKATANGAFDDAAAVNVAAGATLRFNNGQVETIGSLSGAGTVNNVHATAMTLTTGNSTNTTFSGTIQNTGGALSLTKAGAGTFTLTGANSYTGATTISAGALNIQHGSALGGTTGSTTVSSGAALEIQGGITVGAETLNLNGTGVTLNANGALRNVSGNNTYGGGLVLQSATTIKSDADTLTLTGGVTGAFGLTVNGSGNTTVTTNGINTGAATLTKNDSGTLVIAAAGNYTGATTITGGTLEIRNATALGTAGGNTAVQNGATLAISNSISSAEPLAVNGQGVGGRGAIRSLSGTNTLSGTIALGSETYFGVDAGTLTASGVISGSSGLTKVGTGNLILSGGANNSYTGTTAIQAGTLEIQKSGALGGGTGATTIADGATLRVNGTGLSTAEAITVTGAGVGAAGAIQNTGGNNTLTGNVSLTGATTIASDSTNVLTMSGVVSGAYNLVKTGDGVLTLSNAANTYSGTTTIRNGTLAVGANAPSGINGALGNSASNIQIGDNSTVAGNNLSLLASGGGGLTIDRFITVNNRGNTVTLGGNNTAGTNTFTGSVAIAKDVSLTATTTGNVAFTGVLSGVGNVTKVGTGTVTLSGDNTYAGNTTVSTGTLVAASNTALGAVPSTITVASGATLSVQGNISISSGQSLALTGTGNSSVGALNNISGTNTVAGDITLSGAPSIGAAGGTLNLTGAISGATTLTKVGSGEVVLGGSTANTYSGLTSVNAGTLALDKSGGASALGTGNVQVNSGGILAINRDNQISSTATLILNGGTFSTRNNSNTIGTLSLAAASNIDFGNGDSSILTFTNAARTAGALTIDNWNGIPTVGGGGSQMVFSNPGTGFGGSDIVFTGFGAGWTRLASGEIVPVATSGTTYNWTLNAAGNWNANANWNPNTGSPTVANDTAVFSNNLLTASRTVSLNAADRTLGYLAFSGNSTNQYTISGNNLNFDVTAGNAQIQVDDAASPTISSGIFLNDKLNISSSSSGNLTISGAIRSANTTSQDLSVGGSGRVIISGQIGVTTTNPIGNLTKSGASTLVLSNANNAYNGTTTVTNGTLQIGANAPSGAVGALGNSTSAVILGNATTPSNASISLLSDGAGTGAITVGRAITVNSNGATTTIGGINTGGTNTFSGAITLNKDVTLTAATGGTVNFTGQLTAGTGTQNLTKSGGGIVTLNNAANNYNGATNITAGTLRVGTANSVPNTTAVTVASGATFDLNALSETVGSLAGAGTVALGVPGGARTFNTGGDNSSTLFSGGISGGANAAFTKSGTGIMTLSGTNTYLGTTTVSGGTLVAASAAALGGNTAGTTVNVGATLGVQGNITIAGEALSLAASTSPSAASIANLSGTNTLTGTISLTGGNANDDVKIDAATGSTLTLSGIISQATNAKDLTKTGGGTLILSGANTYTGSTNVAAGTLIAASNGALASTVGATSVQIGATLGFQNSVTIGSGEAISLYGTIAPPSAPSLKNVSGNNTVAGAITLYGGINTGVSIESTTAGDNLTLSGAITQATNANYITKIGDGTVTLSGTGANTFTGGFTINEGTVIAAKTAGLDATGGGNVNIGDGSGGAASAVLQLNASNQINNSSSVTIATDGQLNLGANSDSIGALTMAGGSVIGSGTLGLGNNLTFNGVGTSTASISANLDLGTTGTRTVQVGNNGQSNDTDLNISGAISGGTGGLNKTDLGTLQISGSTPNSFSGTFQVSDGTVQLAKTGLGENTATGSGAVSVGNGVGAANSATLSLIASNQINDASRVTVFSDGRLQVGAGLTETIGSFAGAGTIEVGVLGSLIAGGDNTDTTFGGTLQGAGKIEKVGNGTLTFNSNINFPGTLTLNGGTVALGTTGAGINFTVGTLHITGSTTLDFANSAASFLTASNVIIDPGAVLTITNWVHLQDYFYATGNFQLFGNPNTGYDVGGMAPQNQIVFTGFSGDATHWQSWDHQITPAPEPSTYGAVLMSGVLGLLGYRRWRRAAPGSKK